MLHAMVNTPIPSNMSNVKMWMAACQQITPSNGDVLHFAQSFPECLNGIVRGPHCGYVCAIGFELPTGDGAISGVQMCDHVSNGNFSKPKYVIIEHCQVQSIDSFQDLFLHFFFECGCNGELL